MSTPATVRALACSNAHHSKARNPWSGRSHERVREAWMPKGGSLPQLLRQQGWQDGERLIEQVRQRFLAEQRLSPVPMLLGQRR